MSTIRSVVQYNSSDRPWHLPVVAGLCVGIPVLIGFFTGYIVESKLAAFGALVILYLQSDDLATRLKRLYLCSILMLISFAVGLLFSFNIWVGSATLGLWSMLIHYNLPKLKLTRPPGNFFFIMVTAIGLTRPFDSALLGNRLIAMSAGILCACVVGSIYSWILLRQKEDKKEHVVAAKDHYVNITESVIFGLFLACSLLVAYLMRLDNPYWVPVSTLAIMHGISRHHVWTRFIQRILGTLLGALLLWLILQLPWSPLGICLLMIGLQIIVEVLVVRNYALAAVFITMMTILLAESNVALLNSSNELFANRLVDIVIGSAIGMLGGILLYHEKIHFHSKQQLRRSKALVRKLKKKVKKINLETK